MREGPPSFVLGCSPVDMQIQHFIQRQLRKIGIRVVQDIVTRLHGCFAKMDTVLVFHRVGPTQVIMPCVGTDISKHGAAVTLASLTSSPNVIDQFVVIKREIARDVTMPFCEFDTPTEVKFVIFPDANHGWHDFHWQWQR